MKKYLLLAMLFSACSSMPNHRNPAQDSAEDPYIWLEDVHSAQSLDWVKAQNVKSLERLRGNARYATIEGEIRKIVLASDRVPSPRLMGGMIYNFWQDTIHVRGIWRRTSIEDYTNEKPKWETVLDFDALAAAEKENWVYKELECLAPKYNRCLIKLSRGGKDASVIREFDLVKMRFVKRGFVLPEAKTDVTWLDQDTLLVGTDWGKDSMTTSGYPRITKIWRRGTPLADAKTILEGETTDVSTGASVSIRPEGKIALLSRDLTFFSSRKWLLGKHSELKKIEIPEDSIVSGVFQNQLLVKLRTDWQVDGRTFKSGSLLSIRIEDIAQPKPEIVFEPDAKTAIQSVTATRNRLFIEMLVNVNGQVVAASHDSHGWKLQTLPLPNAGSIALYDGDAFDHRLITQFETFVEPSQVLLHSDRELSEKPRLLRQSKARFNPAGMKVEQLESTSLDGTKIPYFLVHNESAPNDGSMPTILYGYGGFEVSETPYYLSYWGKSWIEKGGAFVLANIRGGGEFGPSWHNSVLKKDRHKAYEDFISVAEDLIARKITSPRHLGIRGGSNGGLLVGATFVLRPDLFNGVSCEVPLLDMIRYPLIGAGSSWMGEYGDPKDPEMAEAILKYSPYQNVKADVKYPLVFFSTATTDDRVSPAHARKMSARMEAQGHDVLFYENTNGGHSGAANLEEVVKDRALILEYFFQRLADTQPQK